MNALRKQAQAEIAEWKAQNLRLRAALEDLYYAWRGAEYARLDQREAMEAAERAIEKDAE